jgi:hypothetical protein
VCPIPLFDPASDLAAVVRAHHDGPQLLDGIVAESIVAPAFPHVLGALHAAAEGDMGPVNAFLDAVREGEAAPADELSQGLHESTLCLDLPAPWSPQASSQERFQLLSRQAARLPATAFFPYDRATATGNGIAPGCAGWPSTAPPALGYGDPDGRLPPAPVLLLDGARDLSTPLAWAREEAARAPDGHLVVVPDAGTRSRPKTRPSSSPGSSSSSTAERASAHGKSGGLLGARILPMLPYSPVVQ